ncbi:MAG: ubiquitin-like domain-containing protein [Desulfotomaculales bacterium]
MKRPDIPKKHVFSRRRRLLQAVVVAVLVTFLAWGGYAWAQKEITVVDDGKEIEVTTFGGTVASVLEEAGIALGPKDEVKPGLDVRVRDGMRVEVTRAIEVRVVNGEVERVLLTCARTVGEVLRECGIDPGGRDIVAPSPDTPISDKTTINITRVTTRYEEKRVPVPYGTRRENSMTVPSGQVRVAQDGIPGEELQRWEVVLYNGKEVQRRLIEQKVVKQPRDKVILVGMAAPVSRGVPADLRYSRVINMRSTGYTYTGRNTASGVPPARGTAAVDPSVVPLGTRLFVEGYGTARALDVGSSVKGNQIDLFFPTRSEALSWGVRWVNVYILD